MIWDHHLEQPLLRMKERADWRTAQAVDDAVDGGGWIDYDTKVLFIRRNDTGKLVSLNLRDLQTGRLTLND